MAKRWTKDETCELIALYELNPILWDISGKDYRNRDKRNLAFQDMSVKLGCSPGEVQRKIHNLRNQVSQELKKMKRKKTGSGANGAQKTDWPFFSVLKFLIPGLTIKSRKSNLDALSGGKRKAKNAYTEDNAEENPRDVVNETITIGSEKNNRKGNKRKSIESDDDDEEDAFQSAFKILERAKDEYDSFGDYVAMELRSLRHDYNRRRLKSEIRKAIVRIADDEDDCYPISTTH